jgi:hypothetical protein
MFSNTSSPMCSSPIFPNTYDDPTIKTYMLSAELSAYSDANWVEQSTDGRSGTGQYSLETGQSY